MQQCLRGCPQGFYRTLLKAPTASTSITLQSMKDMDLYWTLTYKLMLTMLFKIMHWIGPEGCQAKKWLQIFHLQLTPLSVGCAMYLHLINSTSRVGPGGWGCPGLTIACPWQHRAGYILPAKRHASLSLSRELSHCHIPWVMCVALSEPRLGPVFSSFQEKFCRKLLFIQYFDQED